MPWLHPGYRPGYKSFLLIETLLGRTACDVAYRSHFLSNSSSPWMS